MRFLGDKWILVLVMAHEIIYVTKLIWFQNHFFKKKK